MFKELLYPGGARRLFTGHIIWSFYTSEERVCALELELFFCKLIQTEDALNRQYLKDQHTASQLSTLPALVTPFCLHHPSFQPRLSVLHNQAPETSLPQGISRSIRTQTHS